MPDFIESLKDTLDHGENNVSVTENGALGYKTTGKSLLDLNFMLASLRSASDESIWKYFLSAYNENPDLAVVWLFFARDCRGGSGERRLFRVVYPRLASENPALAIKLLHFIPEYGRWDDLIQILDNTREAKVRNVGYQLICEQFHKDVADMKDGKPVSLLGKWMPSLNTSSVRTKSLAGTIRGQLGCTPRQYRKTLSALRRHIDVVERKMSANEWKDIDYQGVPSKAMLNYRKAFMNHDEDGFQAYLDAVKSGNAKIHSGTLFPYEIYHAYTDGWKVKTYIDDTLETQWKALPNTVPPDKGTLVVVDGSGSMTWGLGESSVQPIDIARSLGLYFSERLTSAFRDTFITFSSSPRLVRLNPDFSLRAKIETIEQYNDCSNTDIEKTFNLVLDTAIKWHMKQAEMPANILIISDMEFDDISHGGYGWSAVDKRLFSVITERFEAAGYKLPRLVFWNVASRTGTIPLIENDLGVALVSGFSPSIADMVMSGKLDPWECLVDKLTSERYLPILKEVRSAYAKEN